MPSTQRFSYSLTGPAPLLYSRLMSWLRKLRETLSYKLGSAHGRRGKPCKSPWWADKIIYGVGYIDGCKLHP
jgi:hypothetical protein